MNVTLTYTDLLAATYLAGENSTTGVRTRALLARIMLNAGVQAGRRTRRGDNLYRHVMSHTDRALTVRDRQTIPTHGAFAYEALVRTVMHTPTVLRAVVTNTVTGSLFGGDEGRRLTDSVRRHLSCYGATAATDVDAVAELTQFMCTELGEAVTVLVSGYTSTTSQPAHAPRQEQDRWNVAA